MRCVIDITLSGKKIDIICTLRTPRPHTHTLGKGKRNMERPRNVDEYLTRRYYDSSSPGSFTSAAKLHQVIRSEGRYDISLKRIEKWAEGQDILTLHKTPKQRQTTYRRLIMPGSNHLWDVDLLVLNGQRFVASNSGYAYILITVDVFDRYCRARAVKNKGGKEMKKAFESIFNRAAARPLFIRSDHGNEFSNALVQQLFKERGIKHYYANTETKSNYAEILIKTIKRKLFRFFQRNNSYAYVKDLQSIVDSYNSTLHQSIGRAPRSVTKDNQEEVWDYQYVKHSRAYMTSLKRALKKANASGSKRGHRFRYDLGQTVRAAYFRAKPFDRAYDEQFTGEIFTIRKRELIENIPIYFLKGFDGEEVKGHFYESEITAAKYDPNALFKIEKVVSTRVRNGVKESLVKFQSWPSRYNQYLPTSSLVRLNGPLADTPTGRRHSRPRNTRKTRNPGSRRNPLRARAGGSAPANTTGRNTGRARRTRRTTLLNRRRDGRRATGVGGAIKALRAGGVGGGGGGGVGGAEAVRNTLTKRVSRGGGVVRAAGVSTAVTPSDSTGTTGATEATGSLRRLRSGRNF